MQVWPGYTCSNEGIPDSRIQFCRPLVGKLRLDSVSAALNFGVGFSQCVKFPLFCDQPIDIK